MSTNKQIEIATVNTQSIANKTMPIAKVIAILETLGFSIIERENRARDARFNVPEWYATKYGASFLNRLWQSGAYPTMGKYDIRDLAIDALGEWDKYINPTIEIAPIESEPETEQTPEPEMTTEPEPEPEPEQTILITPNKQSDRDTLALIDSAQQMARRNPNRAIKIRAGYYVYFSTAYNALLEIEKMEYSEFTNGREWLCRYADTNEGMAYRSTLGAHLGELSDAAQQMSQTPEPTEDSAPEPTDAPEYDREAGIRDLIEHRAFLCDQLSGASENWQKEIYRECIASVDYVLSMANRAPLALGAFSPLAIGAIKCTIKIINDTGKYEVIESSSVADMPIGKQGNSTLATRRDLGSVWLITCHLTDKGSVKIDSISEPTEPEPEPTEPTSSIAPLGASVAPTTSSVTASGSVTTTETPKSIPEPKRVLSANISDWQSEDYYISPDARKVFEICYKLLQKDSRQSGKILMTGESGYGKTTIAERFAAFVGFDCFRMNCATVRDTEEWFFDREVKTIITNGVPSPETVFTPSEFSQRIARGNCVIILDEFNRLESNLHNSLFPLLDDAGKTTLHHIDFTVGENVIFVATVNLGAKFVGTFLLDDALTNRFDLTLEVRPIPFDHECAILQRLFQIDETDADLIVKMASILRENDFSCSTRDTLKIARMVSVGASIRDGFEYRVIRRIPEDESNAPLRKSLVDLVNKSLGVRSIEFSLAS